jgi:TorA maturation chaperone TorD
MGNGQERRARLTELSRARQDVYAFLGSAFLAPPGEQSLRALANEEFVAGADELFDSGVLDSLRQYATAAKQTAELQQGARQEFMNLFKVPGGQYITPYESVFRDARDVGGKSVKGLLMGQSAVNVQKWYKLAAVEISDEYKDLPDHIGLELNFLAHVCAKEQEFAEKGDQARLTRAWEIERDFLAAHVVSWVVQLRDKLYKKSQHAYFRTVADLLVEFSKRDLTTLENVVGQTKRTLLPEYEAIG